jgi:hypothetical protein
VEGWTVVLHTYITPKSRLGVTRFPIKRSHSELAINKTASIELVHHSGATANLGYGNYPRVRPFLERSSCKSC